MINRMPTSANKLCQYGFTLAETLITIVVIGIIAAITVPILQNSSKWKVYDTAAKKARTTIGEAFRLMSINEEASDKYANAEEFVKKVLPKYLKLGKTCSNAQDCDFPTKLKRPDGSEIEISNYTKMSKITEPYGVKTDPNGLRDAKDGLAAFGGSGIISAAYSKSDNPTVSKYDDASFFVTLDGFHVMFFYNPYCINNERDRVFFINTVEYNPPLYSTLSLDTVCFWGVYDMNGTKAPNQVGQDIGFVGSFYKGEKTQAASVLPHNDEKPTSELSGGDDHLQRARDYCAKLDKNNYVLPDINELSLIFLNRYLVKQSSGNWFWSRSERPKTVSFNYGQRSWPKEMKSTYYVRCVRNTVMQ